MPGDGWNRAPHEEDCLFVTSLLFLSFFPYVFAEIQTFIAMHIGGIHLRDYDTARQWYEKAGAQGGSKPLRSPSQ
jgi:hypothetical protein